MNSIGLLIIDTFEKKFFPKHAIESTLNLKRIKSVYSISNSSIISGEELIPILPINSLANYSDLILNFTPYFLKEDYLLIVQWDGFAINQTRWTDDFLRYDYIGAPWINTPENLSVGNGGFSLRSKKFIHESKELNIKTNTDSYKNSAEDVLLCQEFKGTLESKGGVFSNIETAKKFSFEDVYIQDTFGFHGAFNFTKVFKEEILIENIDEIYNRIKNNKIALKLILNAIDDNQIEFAHASINTLNSDPTRKEDILKILNPLGHPLKEFFI